MVPSPSCRDTSINDECYKPTSCDHGRTELVAGDCISLSCGALSDCSNITWLFSYNNTMTVELVDKGKVRSEYKEERVCVTKECSLEVKKLRKEDEGPYTCRSILSSGGHVDHIRYDLKLITSTHRPTTTTVKVFLPHGVANTTCTSTSKPSTTPVKGAASSSPAARPSTSTPTTHTLNGGPIDPGFAAGVALGTAVLLIVGLVLLIRWLRRRGNKRPKDPTTTHLSVDGDQGGGPTYASIVLYEGQRSVATAQDEDGSSDAVTYSSVRASPRC
ncbi:paired immunoglobulin-like type 2 receptor alpha isoform X5 [Gadus morhua]|uniref:paired immunoglobulin-like type 2 receptor alpha isoform X5 n=1 Tax=Gadus morhua TaxID=8049 RepID=UPI0011B4F583|nr:paired immunoglobulin-like type 2 receptor alpha isoform X5 [Gadus morhua]